MDELKPCPFCGKNGTYIYIHTFWNGINWWQVKCRHCKCSGGARPNEHDAISSWNTRNDEAARKDEIDRKDALLREVYDAARDDWRFSDERISYIEPQLGKDVFDDIAEALTTEEDK